MQEPKRVIVETPFAGDIEENIRYAQLCVSDCIKQGEAPFASHLFYPQPNILEEDILEERMLGIGLGYCWMQVASAVVFYIDRGFSTGMVAAEQEAKKLNKYRIYRNLPNYMELFHANNQSD